MKLIRLLASAIVKACVRLYLWWASVSGSFLTGGRRDV